MNLEEILDYIGTIPFQQLDVKSLEARKQKKLEEVEKCKRLKTSLYEDMKDGILTKEEYLELHEAHTVKFSVFYTSQLPQVFSVFLLQDFLHQAAGKELFQYNQVFLPDSLRF